VRGIEPPSPAWEAGALPLSYTRTSRIIGGGARLTPRDKRLVGSPSEAAHGRRIPWTAIRLLPKQPTREPR
jgi:hypothetical protein